MSPTTPSNTGSLKIGRPRSRSKSPFRSFRWKRGSSSRAADSDDEAGKDQVYVLLFFLNKFCFKLLLSKYYSRSIQHPSAKCLDPKTFF